LSSDHPIFTSCILESAVRVAKSAKAKALMVYVDGVDDVARLVAEVEPPTGVVFIARDEKDAAIARSVDAQVVTVPAFSLGRMGQIKMATIMAFSQGLLKAGDTLVFASGVIGQGLDTIMVMRLGTEYELLMTVDQPRLTEHIRSYVFQRVLNIAMEIAHQGREGKAMGALFVVGDYREVRKYCLQNIMNPFHGYSEKARNILDETMAESVKEFAAIDGAFIIKGNGVIASAGTTVQGSVAGSELPQGLGARHAAAAGITATTLSIAISVSQSTGTVTIWRRGKIITEFEKAARPPLPMRTKSEESK
jgi:DNA integrity scanning protein DisA with diadenylate cyclase activity